MCKLCDELVQQVDRMGELLCGYPVKESLMLWDTSRWEDDMVEEDKRHPFAWSPGPKVREICTTQVYTPSDPFPNGYYDEAGHFHEPDPFASARAGLARIKGDIAQLYSDLDRVLPPLIERGQYWEADQYRARVLERVRELERDRREVRQLMPPFTTYKDGIYYRHPVTDENWHLLQL